MSQSSDESLMASKLFEGDRSSIIVAGMVAAHALKETGVCVLAVDAMGRVVICPSSTVTSLDIPKLKKEDLDALSEEEAIEAMVKEGRDEPEILSYLATR